MVYTPTKTLSFDEFIAQYGDNPRYELIDGELRDMEPTGPHEAVTGKLSGYIFGEILRLQRNWVVPKNCPIKPPALSATALRPDGIILDEDLLSQEPLWQKEPIVCDGSIIRLIVEVVGTKWQNDYDRKLEEYAFLGIKEYWIVDYVGIGGITFTGKPKQPIITVCQFKEDGYIQQQFGIGQPIVSLIFPQLRLKLDDILPRR
jgi:Uma2 family endonuclease